MLTLHYSPGACSRAVHIALEEAGAAFALARVDLAAGAQNGAAFRAVNPKGRVPALVTERGVLTETPALLAWVAAAFPAADLAPADPFDFARMQAFNVYLAATVHVAHAHRWRGSRWADDPAALAAMAAKVPSNMADCYGLIEAEMFAGPWVMGAQYTVADPYLFTLSGWLAADGVDLARFPVLLDHQRRMRERPAVARAVAREEAARAA